MVHNCENKHGNSVPFPLPTQIKYFIDLQTTLSKSRLTFYSLSKFPLLVKAIVSTLYDVAHNLGDFIAILLHYTTTGKT